MLPWITDVVVAAAVTGLLGVIGGSVSSSGAVRAAAVEAAERERELIAAPYKELAERVTALEREAEQLRKQLNSVLSRERQWQDGWDKLRRSWHDMRQCTEPPPYPVQNLRGEE